MRIRNMIVSFKMPKKYDLVLHAAVIVLVLFGTLMILSANVGETGESAMVIVKVLVKQIVFIIVSYTLMTFLANNFSMRRAKNFLPIIAIVLFCALVATQFKPDATNGSKAWISFWIAGQQITIQPAEFAKVFMVVVMAVYIEMAGRNDWDFKTIMKGPFLYFMVCIIPIALQKDIGSMLVFLAICSMCFLLPSHRGLRKPQRYFKIFIAVGVVLAIILMSNIGIHFFNSISSLQHIAVRIENAQNPFLDPFNKGYQLINGLYGIARGGFTGVGLGNSIQKYGYLTQSDNDFILAIIIEELGIFGFGLIVLLYGVVIQRLFYYAMHSKSDGFKIILFGTAMYIFIHFVLNVGGISGLIPLTGVPLLFVSSGGSSLMSVMSAIGLSQAVIARIRRQGSVAVKKEPQGDRGSIRKGRGETKIGG